jgi:quercetin dioxygenase-like cupin family protein
MFPDIIQKIPLRDYSIDGLEVHVDHTSIGTVYFVSTTKEIIFPVHSHAEQWSIVVRGECRFTMNGETKIYRQGDTYRIPAGVPHQITLSANYSEVDYVADPND